jgi:hypothetical protein
MTSVPVPLHGTDASVEVALRRFAPDGAQGARLFRSFDAFSHHGEMQRLAPART